MLSEKVCLVTGGGNGIGEATAKALGDRGASVVVNDLGTSVDGSDESPAPALSTARIVRNAGGDALAHFGDVASLEYTETLVEDAVAEYGRIDGVVNFAGILDGGMSYELTGEQWDRVVRVHLRGHFALLRSLARHWRERAREAGGELATQRSFLGVGSEAPFGSVGQANYAAAKAGVQGLVRTAARELATYNVRANTIIPRANTRMTDALAPGARPFDEDLPAENVAEMVAFLLSDEATDVTGCTVLAGGDHVGLLSDPVITRRHYREGGWSARAIADRVSPAEWTPDMSGTFE